jgi:formylglycine-generating enzyme required for sulfatase activity
MPSSRSGHREPEAPGEWVLVKAGSFVMGSPTGEPGKRVDEISHPVTITRDFWLQATEVTQGQFQDAMGYNPSNFTSCGQNCPVERVSWSEAAAYCNALSLREGLRQCYSCSGSGREVSCDTSSRYSTLYTCPGYRLPTEAEWEHAARAGTTTALYTGSITILGEMNAPALDPIAWYGGNSGVSYSGGFDCSSWTERQRNASTCGTHPVRQKRPNSLGLYDMLGNVWEWCHDWYGEYPTGVETDPVGPGAGSGRVLRGGSWNLNAGFTRTAYRDKRAPGSHFSNFGFRPSRSLP